MLTEYICTPEDEGRKLYGILRRELALSLTQLRRIKPAGGIFVNDAQAHTDYRVKPGDRVHIRLDAVEKAPDLIPQDGPVDVLWEGEGLLIVNKPCGILVHPTHAQQIDTLANYVSGYLQRSCGSAACHVVNRLDRDTGGAVLFAKSARMKHLASLALAEESAVKEYVALVYGAFKEPSGIIDLPIRRESPENMRRIAAPDGQSALTIYETVETAEDFSLMRFRIVTGRTHQIRVHCFESGHPILGDRLYKTEASDAVSQRLGIEAQALHACRLAFREGRSGECADVTAPIVRSDLSKIIGNSKFTIDKPKESDI